MERRREIYCDQRIPALHREGFDHFGILDTGIVHENIDGAEMALGRLDQIFDLVRNAHVCAVKDRLDAMF